MFLIVSTKLRHRSTCYEIDMTLLVIYNEMAKICSLKANIVYMDTIFEEGVYPQATQSAIEDIQEWHSQLPAAVRLSSLDRHHGAYSNELRRAVYHVHLLYLGAVNLLHRRIVSQYCRSGGGNMRANVIPQLQFAAAYRHSQNGIFAARQSATILKLLRSENSIPETSWLVMYVSKY
jgi:hypothetical protein